MDDMSGRGMVVAAVNLEGISGLFHQLEALLSFPMANATLLMLGLLAATWQRRRLDRRCGGRFKRGIDAW